MRDNRQRCDGGQQRQPRKQQNEEEISGKFTQHTRTAWRRHDQKDQSRRLYSKNYEKTIKITS